MIWKTAAEFMKKDPISVGPDTRLSELLTVLRDEQIHGVPVIDKQGTPLGVVSMTDMTRTLGEESDELDVPSPFYQWLREDRTGPISPVQIRELDLSRRVKQIMSARVVSAPEATSVGALAAIMLKEKVHRILITGNGKLIGIVSVTDLLKCVVETEKNQLQESFDKVHRSIQTSRTEKASQKATTKG